MSVLRTAEAAARIFGFEPRRGLLSLSQVRAFARQRREYLKQAQRSDGEFPMGRLYPCLDDAYMAAGTAKGHYFHQDLHVARRIFERSPARHVDVGSRVDGFVAHVAAFREIEVFDIRPLDSLPGIVFKQCDLMNDTVPAEYADSVSCLHALEHFGLGRYGDPVDYYGHLRGMSNLVQLLQSGAFSTCPCPLVHSGRSSMRTACCRHATSLIRPRSIPCRSRGSRMLTTMAIFTPTSMSTRRDSRATLDVSMAAAFSS